MNTRLRSFLTCTLIALMLSACSDLSPNDKKQKYPEMVGDIAFDPVLDRDDFKLCNERILQYYNFGDGVQYEGERPALLDHFETRYTPVSDWDGYVSVRFVVNCDGETDRYRLSAMDYDYVEEPGQLEVNEGLLAAVRSMDGWMPKTYDEIPLPYYQYLTFRIAGGHITEILP